MSHNTPVSKRLLAAIGAAVAVAMSTTTVTAAPDQSPSAHYDLRYSVTDDRLQIFDDGVNTRMLLPEGTQIPLVRTLKSGAEQLVVLQREAGTQFILIPGLHHRLILTWPGQRHVNVSYQGNAQQAARAGANVAYGAAPVAQVHGLAAAPMQPPAPTLDPGVSGQVAPAPMVATMPAMAGATPDHAGVAVEAPAPTVGLWEIKPSDGTLSRALIRWSREAKTQLVYEAPSDLAAVSVSYTGDYWVALDSLLADTANGGYPLHGCQYNNVTRILHVSQPCDR